LNCWACSSRMICQDSRDVGNLRERKRRYVCPKCGENTYTLEKIISHDEYERLMRKDKYVKK